MTNEGFATYSIAWDLVPVLCQSSDLSVSEIIPGQAVDSVDINDDGRIDLVLGKPLIVRVYPLISNAASLPPIQLVDVELTFQGNTLIESRPASDLMMRSVDFFLTPRNSGDSTIQVTVDPRGLIQETNETNNQASLMVSVKPVRDINLAYMQVNYLGETPNFATTVLNSGDYLQAVFPVAQDQFINQRIDTPVTPDVVSFLPDKRGAAHDARILWLEGKLLPLFRAERIIGIVPKNWFTYHQLGDFTEGVFFPMVSEVAFVLDGRPLVTAHELGHTYGLVEGYVPFLDETCCLSEGEQTGGFWVQRRREILPISIDFMGTSPGGVIYPDGAGVRWATQGNFTYLFRQFRTRPNDPELLLVTGTISQTDEVTLDSMYRAMEGEVSQPVAGDASLRVLDASGNVLAEIPFIVDFRVLTDPPTRINAAPFAFAVPYPANAVRVQITRAGQVLVETSVATKLLRDAIASIPDAGFIQNPSQPRIALQNKVDALEQQLASGNLAGARNKLRDDIRKHLVDWLIDGYSTQTPRQYSKTAIIELVDELLQRLGE